MNARNRKEAWEIVLRKNWMSDCYATVSEKSSDTDIRNAIYQANPNLLEEEMCVKAGGWDHYYKEYLRDISIECDTIPGVVLQAFNRNNSINAIIESVKTLLRLQNLIETYPEKVTSLFDEWESYSTVEWSEYGERIDYWTDEDTIRETIERIVIEN